jgi:hypothetical protein
MRRGLLEAPPEFVEEVDEAAEEEGGGMDTGGSGGVTPEPSPEDSPGKPKPKAKGRGKGGTGTAWPGGAAHGSGGDSEERAVLKQMALLMPTLIALCQERAAAGASTGAAAAPIDLVTGTGDVEELEAAPGASRGARYSPY